MNSVRKVCTITALGLLMVFFVYPLLHESGHSLFAIILGADILEFKLWHTPYVLSNMSDMSTTSSVIVGVGGVLLPILFSACIPQRQFWIWYCNMILVGIETLSVGISLVAIICFGLGNPMANEDITTILLIAPSTKPVLFTVIRCRDLHLKQFCL